MENSSISEKLKYPFDSEWILKKKKGIRRELLASDQSFLEKKIAVLGGSTTSDIVKILDLFLLNAGIKAEFYESEYNKYWEDIMFGNEELKAFRPDLIWIHTTGRNLLSPPDVDLSGQEIDERLDSEYERFHMMWEKIFREYNCPIIQNNFEYPYYRLLGNRDVSDIHGMTNYIHRMNSRFYGYAMEHENFHIHDINYISACYGLDKWSDPFYWCLYKYAVSVPAIPEFSYNLANIVKSIFGKNKKAFVLDLDNTLWGGVVGEDGAEKIEIGHENATAEMYTEFQTYLKAHKKLGILLTVDSKNDEENALAGLRRPDSVLRPEDFVALKANWNPKDQNIRELAAELNIGTDSFVFIDDNPAERHIVRQNHPEVSVPEIGSPETYIRIIDRSGFFEVTSLSEDDRKRTEMYAANSQRARQQASFENYTDYLLSLEMKADILPFSEAYMARIAQLTNKSNQFNLTTLRCTQSDVEYFAQDENHITLYGRLEDKFGDNGVVAVTSGHREGKCFHIDLWLLSCRVLKRDMECAMMDTLVWQCRKQGIEHIIGCYYPTAKNSMVKDFYKTMGFELTGQTEDGSTTWEISLNTYSDLNHVIRVNKGDM